MTQVTIGAHDAAFLLSSVEGGGGGGGGGGGSTDTVAPNTSVSNPTSGSSVPVGTVSLAGSATDDHGLSGVQVAIRDTATNQWLRRDGSWGNYQVMDATLGSSILMTSGDAYVPWTYSWSTTKTGTFEVQAVALDPAGNVDASPASSSFSVVGGVTPPPTPTPTPTPTANPDAGADTCPDTHTDPGPADDSRRGRTGDHLGFARSGRPGADRNPGSSRVRRATTGASIRSGSGSGTRPRACGGTRTGPGARRSKSRSRS